MVRPPDAETLLDFTQEKLVVLDDEGRFQYLNAAVRDVLGFEPDDLVGEDAFALIHPEDEPRIRTVFEEVVAGDRGTTETLEYRYGTVDGDWLWMRSDVYTREATGIDGYVLSSRDVTDEVESIRRLETIVSTSADVLWMFDPEWSEVLFVNDAAEDVFGIEPETLERNPQLFLDRVHPEDRQHVERAMDRLSAGEPTNIDYRVEPPEGGIRWVRVPGEPVHEDGEIVAVAGFARDVTDEYRHKRQLEVMDNLLRHSIRNDMNVVIGTAERIIEAVERIGSDRAALAAANDEGNTDTDLSPEVGSAADTRSLPDVESIADVETAAETIRRVAESLLDTAEKQRDVIELVSRGGSPRPIDIEPIVRESVAEARAGAPAAEFSVSCPTDAEAFALPELEYAVSELVENAVEHAEADPEVDVTVARVGGDLEITIRDNCPLIPPEERHIIADQWQMDDVHHTVGMGLWLAYWVTDRSGGDLSFDTHGNGNVVTVRVPNDCSETRSSPDDS